MTDPVRRTPIKALAVLAAAVLGATWFLERATRGAGVTQAAPASARAREVRETPALGSNAGGARPVRAERPAERAFLRLTAIDASERTPLAGVRVRATRAASDEVRTRPPTTTGADGQCVLELRANVDWWLTLEAQGHAERAFLLAALEDGERRELTLEFDPRPGTSAAGPLAGRIVDRVTGRPVPNATVAHEGALVRTDDEGCFHIEGGGQALIGAPGYVTLRVESSPAARGERRAFGLARHAQIHIRLDPGHRVHASVAPADLVLDGEGTLVPRVLEWTALSDTAGTCTLVGLPPDVPLRIERSHGDVRKALRPTPLVLRPGEKRELRVPAD